MDRINRESKRSCIMRPLHWLLAICIGLLSCGQLQAAFHLLENTNGAFLPSPQADELGVGTGRALEVGSVFQVVANPSPNPISVSALGFYDNGLDGLAVSHYVQLFQLVTAQNNPGTYQLIAQVTVPAGTGGTLDGSFRYTSLGSPVNLTASGTYLLLASVGALSTQTGQPLDSFAQFTEPVGNVPSGPLNADFVPGNGATAGLGTAKSSIDTSGFSIGSQLFNPTSGVPNNNTTTIVQPGENHPFLVNLQFST
jgi:hypothetical protein